MCVFVSILTPHVTCYYDSRYIIPASYSVNIEEVSQNTTIVRNDDRDSRVPVAGLLADHSLLFLSLGRPYLRYILLFSSEEDSR